MPWSAGFNMRVVPSLALILLLSVGACGASPALVQDRAGSAIEGGPMVGMDAAEMSVSQGVPMPEAPADMAAGNTAVAFAERKLIFTGDMGLRVEDVAVAMAAARTWTEAHAGFVEQESVAGEGSSAYGQMTLRVPQDEYEATRQQLRELAAEVLDDNSQRQDVTGQYADLDARLKNLKATEAELQELLTQVREEGGGAEAILAVYRELTNVRGQIESLQAQIDTLGEQVALSTLRVRFEPPPTSAAEVTESWAPGRVFRQALADLAGAFQWLGNVLIYLVVTAPFWILPVLAVWALWRFARRRRRRTSSGEPTAPPPLPQE